MARAWTLPRWIWVAFVPLRLLSAALGVLAVFLLIGCYALIALTEPPDVPPPPD